MTSTASSPPSWCSADVLGAVVLRARAATRDLVATHRAFASTPQSRTHGALAVAVSTAQQLLKALELIKEEQNRNRCAASPPSSNSIAPSFTKLPMDATGGNDVQTGANHTSSNAEVLQQLIEAEKYRIELRRLLPRAVAAIEESDDGGGPAGSTSTRSAASAAASLRSLLQTRSLLSVELQKMDTATSGLASTTQSLHALQHSLTDVSTTMEAAEKAVRKLITIESRDDAILRLSILFFIVVLLYILLQRVGRFFPSSVYVTLDDAN